jgi:GT2 family glycosyltransferase
VNASSEKSSAPAPAAPLFTVIMPVFNRALYVRQAVESVLRQTLADWELIVIDDGSTDDSRRIVEDLTRADPRVTRLRQDRRGPGAARNAGLALARGQWIAYLDSDDLWLPQALEAYAAYLAGHPQACLIYGHAHGIDAAGTVVERPFRYQDRPTDTRDLFAHVFLLPSALCHRRSLIDQAGRFDEDLPNAEDYDLFLRMSLHGRFDPLGAVTTLHRRHATNLSFQTGPTRLCEAGILERFLARHGPQAAIDPRRIRRRLARVYCSAARQFVRSGQYRQALAAVRQAHRYRRTPKSLALAALAACLSPFGRRQK